MMIVFNQWVVQKLIDLSVISSSSEVQMVTWFPAPPFDNYTCAARLHRSVSLPNMSIKADGIEELHFYGNYINIIINNDSFVKRVATYLHSHSKDSNRYKLESDTIKQFSIVEHTSLTPVYPINISTFRSSVIGNALATLLKKSGVAVSVHYLVSDTARNIGLLLEKYDISKLKAQCLAYKNDHVCGVAFCKALGAIGEFNCDDCLLDMFPFSPPSFQSPTKNTFSKDDVKNLCAYCLEGHATTLSNSSIFIDSFDYESETYSEALPEGKTLKPYLSKSIAYYAFLASTNTTAFSIVSNRQQHVISTAISYLPEHKDVRAIFYHDVFFLEGNLTKADKIKSGIFHSVDGYEKNASEYLGVDPRVVADALKLLLLASNPNCSITLNCNTYCDIKEYVDLLLFLRQEIMAVQTWEGSVPEDSGVAKYLLLLNNSFSVGKVFSCTPQPKFDISPTIAIIMKISHVIRTEYLLKNQKINHSLLEAYRALVFEILDSVGV